MVTGSLVKCERCAPGGYIPNGERWRDCPVCMGYPYQTEPEWVTAWTNPENDDE